MRIDQFIVAYVFITLGIISILSGISFWRQRSFRQTPRSDRIFWCKGCNYVYTDDPDVDYSRCPHCKRENEPVKF